MTQTDYLAMNFGTSVPKWLEKYSPGYKISLNNVLSARLVFYPGSGLDWHAIEVFGKSLSAAVFVYVDYMIRREDILQEIETSGISGYRKIGSVDYSEEDLFAACPPHCSLTQEEMRTAVEEFRRLGGIVKPYSTLIVLEKANETEIGLSRIAILFIGADAVATYDAFFASGRYSPPFAMLSENYGFGGCYTPLNSGGLLELIARRSKALPQLILSVDEDRWTGYERLRGIDGSIGGMHRNLRFLSKRELLNRMEVLCK